MRRDFLAGGRASWFQALDLDTAEFFLQRLHFHVAILHGGEVCDG
jgi:hypothetical protein